MKDESEPITDDEWFLRRVIKDRFPTDESPLISPNAFEPRLKGRDIDTDGISLYREACLADPSEALPTVVRGKGEEGEEKQRPVPGLVRVSKRLLDDLGLSVRSAPDTRVRGHVVIPELNAPDYIRNKAAYKLVLVKLAEAATKEIVRWPTVSGAS